MSKARRHETDSFDDSDLYSDQGFDADDFVDTMEQKSVKRGRHAKYNLSNRYRIEDWQDQKRLKHQLRDWDE